MFSTSDEEAAEAKRGMPAWMLTFSDLMALLVAFFVLILSFSQVDNDSFRRNAGPMAEAFNRPPPRFITPFSEGDPGSGETSPAPRVDEASGGAAAAITREIVRNRLIMRFRSVLRDEIARQVVSIEAGRNFVVLRFPAGVAFASGDGELRPPLPDTLKRVAGVLSTTRGQIKVSGHTDNTPIATERFRSNWDLSSARAASVVHYLLSSQQISSTRVSAIGYADARPLADNATAVGRAKNRRVEVRVEIPLAPQARRVAPRGGLR